MWSYSNHEEEEKQISADMNFFFDDTTFGPTMCDLWGGGPLVVESCPAAVIIIKSLLKKKKYLFPHSGSAKMREFTLHCHSLNKLWE